jgi:hypothetical protein
MLGALKIAWHLSDQSPRGNHLGIERGPAFLDGLRGAQDRGAAAGYAILGR